MPTRLRRPWFAALAAVLLYPGVAVSQEDAVTAGVFRRYSDRVVKVEVTESGSGAKASMGTGFFVSERGHVVTNYHVVSQLIHEPGRYRAQALDAAGEATDATVLAVDVVHDLAVLATEARPANHFEPGRVEVRQGERLYSLGHPSDLGLSIVEGTYNGLLRHTLYPKIHFTGSINPGMSGGPTLTQDGRVVGVNVSTAGNQVSFLVPGDRVATLVEEAMTPGYEPPADLLDRVAAQIRDYQDRYLDGMFTESSPTVELGPYSVATEPAPFFRCWGDADRRPEQPYETVYHRCSTDDYLYIAQDQYSGVVELSHELITTRTLSPRRFFSLYASVFGRDNTPAGTEEHVTSWRCATRNVRTGSAPLRSVLCLRGYRKLAGLYDAVVKVAVLGARESGLVSTLVLSGVTHESVDRLTGRYLENVKWP
jgi:serine protease Do